LRVPNDDSLIDLNLVESFLLSLNNIKNYEEEIRSFAAKKLDYKSKMMTLVSFINQLKNS
jgi:hypothetical protein